MKNLKIVLMITAILGALFVLNSCTSLENKTRSSSYISIDTLRAADLKGQPADFLQSDVQKVDSATQSPYVTADTATATLTAHTLDPMPSRGTSQYEDIMLTRYIVHYSRSDGRGTEGVDVPYAFEGALNTLLKVDQNTDVSFVLVREVAKMEPPLLNLVGKRDVGVLEVKATVEFYGHDMADNAVTATGTITIFFADYITE
jgi:hypothetical protein